VLEVCATYYSWCAGCAAGLSLLLLTGLVLQEARDEDAEHRCKEEADDAWESHRSGLAERFEWG